MAIKDDILNLVSQDPRFGQAVDQMEEQVKDMDMAPDDLDEMIQLLELIIKRPEAYEQIVQAAIKDGLIEEGMLPPQLDKTFIVALLASLYEMQDRMGKKMARGGLASAAHYLASQGRHGDTMLAHISPAEARMLKREGGVGSINPVTGLPEYFKFFKFLKKILPIVAMVAAPVLAPAIGGALGVSGALGSALGGSILGAGTSALTGGNILQGAVLGGLSAGAGGLLGGAMGISNPTLANMAGSGLIGGALGAATGRGFIPGAAMGALGGGIAGAAGSMIPGIQGLSPGVASGLTGGGQAFGNALASGFSPAQAGTAGALAGIASGLMAPSDAAVQQARMNADPTVRAANALPELTPADMTKNLGVSGGGEWTPTAADTAAGAAASGAGTSGGMSLGKMALLGGGALVASNLLQAPPKVKQAVAQMSPKQQEYFNRPSEVWDWGKIERDASRSNMDMSMYMAKNWNKIMGGDYSVAAAHGGPLSVVARFAKGSGSGRDDTIDAKLSDGEYVIDAETVALLGDGSSDEGARRLDEMRRKIRAQKGKALAKGKFSPNAKSPLAYVGAR